MNTSSAVASNCSWCGNSHAGVVCPLVKAIEYHPNGTMKRVEFKTTHDWPQITQSVQPYQNPIISTALGLIA